eukprot:1000652_1
MGLVSWVRCARSHQRKCSSKESFDKPDKRTDSRSSDYGNPAQKSTSDSSRSKTCKSRTIDIASRSRSENDTSSKIELDNEMCSDVEGKHSSASDHQCPTSDPHSGFTKSSQKISHSKRENSQKSSKSIDKTTKQDDFEIVAAFQSEKLESLELEKADLKTDVITLESEIFELIQATQKNENGSAKICETAKTCEIEVNHGSG